MAGESVWRRVWRDSLNLVKSMLRKSGVVRGGACATGISITVIMGR